VTEPIIDPHVHLWDQRATPRETSLLVKLFGWRPATMRWLARKLFPADAIRFFGTPDHLLADYLPADYQADADAGDASVAGFVHVEASWKGKGPLGPVAETRWLESLDAPLLKGIVGYADLSLGADVEPVLRAHVEASPRFRGIRYTLTHHPAKGVLSGCKTEGLARDRTWREGYAMLAQHGLSFDATVYHHQLDDVAALARDFPDVPVILCHAGTPTAYGGPFGGPMGGQGADATAREKVAQEWRDGMARLAERPNVTVKISGLAMPILGWGWEHRSRPPEAKEVAAAWAQPVAFMVDTFGADRCMFASNFPIDKVSMPWATLYAAFAQTVADRREAERRALFGDTARRVYRL
jgi:L-fuconolactonase